MQWAPRAVTKFRLLVTEPLDGPANMALDEALMRGRLRHDSPPTLRFFAWAPPTISLGYGQRLDGRIDEQALVAMGLGLVRRATGGSAILHEGPDLEITYSVSAEAGDFEGANGLLETSRWIVEGVLFVLRPRRPRRDGLRAALIPRPCPPSASRAPSRSSWRSAAASSWAARSDGRGRPFSSTAPSCSARRPRGCVASFPERAIHWRA